MLVLYESHILGSHNGLLSSFSIKTLVLFINNAFHLSVHTPLQVLHKFLKFYSTLNWDVYCMTFLGPVRTTLLPDAPGIIFLETLFYPVEILELYDESLLTVQVCLFFLHFCT